MFMKTFTLLFIIYMLSAYGSYAVAFDNVVGKITCGQKPVSNVLVSDGAK